MQNSEEILELKRSSTALYVIFENVDPNEDVEFELIKAIVKKSINTLSNVGTNCTFLKNVNDYFVAIHVLLKGFDSNSEDELDLIKETLKNLMLTLEDFAVEEENHKKLNII